MYVNYCNLFFFFFQAEDGIRDGTVTGVQTCALPISCWTIQQAPFSATPSSAGRTQKSTSCRSCGSDTDARSTLAFATPGTSETTLRAAAYSGIARSASSSGPSTSTQRPPTSTTLFANRSRRSGYCTALRRARSGSGAGAGTASRSALRISSRADTLPPLRAEALARHRRQLALSGPGIGDARSEDAQQLSEDAIGPGPRQ